MIVGVVKMKKTFSFLYACKSLDLLHRKSFRFSCAQDSKSKNLDMKLKGLALLALTSTLLGCSSLKRYEIHQNPTSVEEKQEITRIKPEKIYAILLNIGPEEKLFEKSFDKTYLSLLEAGISPERIFVSSRKRVSFSHPQFSASSQGVKRLFKELSSKVNENDAVFFFNFNHGELRYMNPLQNESTLFIEKVKERNEIVKKEIGEIEFSLMAKQLKNKYSVYCFPQCYGGGFAKRMGEGNGIGMSVSRANEVAYMLPWTADESTKHFIPALFGELSEKERIKADKNGDGTISIGEAFEHSSERNFFSNPVISWTSMRNTPQLYFDNVNPYLLSFDRKAKK